MSLTGKLASASQAFIEAQQYSQFILDNLPDVLLPEGFYRDVSDFGSGTTLNIKTVGTVTLQDAAEDVPLNFNPIDTGTITLSITDYVGDAWRVTDDLREDGSQIETLMGMRATESTRAFGENHETRFLKVAGEAHGTTTGVGLVNGRPHRWVAGGAGGTDRHMTISDFIAMKLAFDKANVPAAGRIAIVDPVVEATLNSLTNLVNVSNNPMFEGMITSGFAQTHKFVRNIFGWDIYTSNFLPVAGGTSTIDASSYGLANDALVATDKANIFMCVADDSTKPVMHAWRRMPRTEGWRDEETRSDKFQVTSRFGLGVQRLDTIGIIYADALTY